MYKKDKKTIITVFFVVLFLSYNNTTTFSEIASDCIPIVSIVLAIYAISISGLINSNLLKQMQKTQDEEITIKTQLGVLKTYIVCATDIAIITLVLVFISKFDFGYDIPSIIIVLSQEIYLARICSAISISIFSLNFLFVIRILRFTINKQLDNIE